MSVPEPKEFSMGVPDWSTVHQPLGELFEPITNGKDWAKFTLNPEKVEQYWKDGYLLNIPVLTHDQCDRIIEDYKYFMASKTQRGGSEKHPGMEMLYEYHSNQSNDQNNVLMHCLGHWRLTRLFHDLVFLPQVLMHTSQLLNQNRELTKVRFWHDQLFAKPARHGGVVAWHQDFSYWTRTKPMMHLTVHIALDDQTEENGALHYIPGSHRWTRDGGPLPVTDFNFKDMESIKTILTEEEKLQFKPVCGRLKKGEASFHHPLSVHGSYGNR
ncbi:hypothetical protein CHS0354_029495 [Potamilus streckersoni]|uniref:Phytanoyl-CoA dioxygenase n=1 Tax=Potamilus streckersoni TaxID=2493646 RepID=A0AAE0S783_9BIVA|nr:hypothetical protein CHS0354_029495 [Potamilus streckersoni]